MSETREAELLREIRELKKEIERLKGLTGYLVQEVVDRAVIWQSEIVGITIE